MKIFRNRSGRALYLPVILALAGALFLLGAAAVAEAVTFPIPSLTLGVEEAQGPEDVAVTLEIIALMTVLVLSPSILILMTPFTRIVVVFHFLRQAMGTQSTPPNQVVVGLSLFMTFFIMKPVWNELYTDSLSPYMEREIGFEELTEKVQVPVKRFLLKNTREGDLAVFVKAAKVDRPANHDDVSLLQLVPAFVISELKTAFIIGFVLYVPFLVIDMVVASVLLAMGMMMLPPVMISLPFKLMLFVLVDGWNLVVGSMVNSFGV